MTAIVIMGSNVGDRVGYLIEAREYLWRLGAVEAKSGLYSSKPFGETNQPEFLNTALAVETELDPAELLDGLKEIEREIGRTETYRWGPREIDLDIALYEDWIFCSEGLSIPHLGLLDRDFFLAPILEIMPEAVDPNSGMRLEEALSMLPKDKRTIISEYWDERW